MAYRYNVVRGNRAAVITANEEQGPFSIRLWVNVLNGFENADATMVATKRKTWQGAMKWSLKQLAA